MIVNLYFEGEDAAQNKDRLDVCISNVCNDTLCICIYTLHMQCLAFKDIMTKGISLWTGEYSMARGVMLAGWPRVGS